jgi:4-amino-4-deoxy-L-arabinose transferase-like glycosyltransferase
MSSQKFYTLFVLIIILGSILRLWGLDSTPPSLNQDEAVNGVDAYAIANNLMDHHGNFLPPMLQSFNDWASPTLTYLTAPFVKIFGLSVWGIRFVNAFVGILGIPLVYWLVKHFTNSKSASLFGAFVLAIAPFSINLSRWAIPPSVVPTLLLAFLVAFFWTTTQIGKKSYFGIVLTAISGIALVYSYPTMKIYAPILALVMFLVYIKKLWKQFAVGGALFALVISPIYILTITKPDIYNARYNSVKISEAEGFVNGFVSRFFDYFSPIFMFGSSDGNSMHHVPRFGPLPEITGYLIYIGLLVAMLILVDFGYLGRLIKKIFGLSGSVELGTYKPFLFIEGANRHKNLIILVIAFLLFPVPPSMTNEKLILTRAVQGLTLGVVFLSIGYWFLQEQITSLKLKRYINYTIVILSLFGCFQFSYFYFGDYSESVKGQYQYGIQEMFTYLRENESKFDKVEIIDINQPYIYKLFFEPMKLEQYNPKTMTSNIGKYYFGGVNKAGLSGKPTIYEVKDTKKNVWFKVYEYQPRWYIVTR